jgi:glycosyltransferase involved in cell wall biosynthesis
MTDVTIVVVTYNRPAMLDVMLQSVWTSAGEVSEAVRVIVVDDCSPTEDAKPIAKKWACDYVRLPENRGVGGALAAGFELVDSPYYALWGDDDFLLPNWFPLHLATMAEGWDVVAGSYWKADANLKQRRKVVLPPATFAALKRGNVQCNDGSLVRRDSIGEVKFRPERERAMMMTFWLAMAAQGAKFTAIREPTWLYRRHSSNLSNQLTEHDASLRRAAVAEYAA